jgi:hypothetical protein
MGGVAVRESVSEVDGSAKPVINKLNNPKNRNRGMLDRLMIVLLNRNEKG